MVFEIILPKITGMNTGLFFIGITAAFVFLTTSCQSNNHKGEFEYFYYPEKNVYYDSAQKTFFYSLNGAKTWSRFINANNAEPVALGEKVVIYSTATDVYKDNDRHRKLYAGTLYDISISDTGAAVAGAEVSERKIIQKRKSAETQLTEETKVKRGISRLIDKIFGKHHKK